MISSQRVCVIGAGPSGIAAIKNLRDQNLEVVAYDLNQDVGGNWIFNEDPSHSSVFETTHIISSKTLSQYEDYTFEDSGIQASDYPSHDELKQYFQSYARYFDLYPYIQFGTEVQHCQRLEDGTWELTIRQDTDTHKELFTHLVVCNGHHWLPRHPQYPGTFTGEYIHSHQFKKAAPYRGKKVLVIGGGNSACDVAVETSRISAKTAISWRRGYTIVPKFIMGKPSDIVGSRMTFLPVAIRNFLAGLMIKIANGSNEMYGLPKSNLKFGQTHPTVNSELLYKIRHGKVHPYGDIDRYEGNMVHFKDGRSETFDAIIACTGYILAHPFFDESLVNYKEGRPVPLYLKMFHAQYDNLFFVGMFQPLGCIWPGAELQSKLAANAITGAWQRPKNIAQLCEREVSHPHMKQINTARHTITVDYHRFMKDLKKELGKVKKRNKLQTVS